MNERIQEMFSFANYLVVGIFLFFWIDFLWNPWGSPNILNPIDDFLYLRTGGQILYANHLVSAIGVMLVTTYFILKNPFSRAGKIVFVIFSTVSIHEILLNLVLNTFGFTFIPAYYDGGQFFKVLDLRWFFWLSLFLVLGSLFATKEQRKKLVRITLVIVLYMFGWLFYLAISHHSPWTLYQFTPAPMFHDPIDNSLEVFSWLIPLSIWFIPMDWKNVSIHYKIREMHIHNLILYLIRYRHFQTDLETTPSGKMAMAKEQKNWEHDYIPSSGLIGKTVLDVGAGCGETADFFFKHGARKVICVEPDLKKIERLRRNAQKQRWDIEVIPDVFKLKHLSLPFDYAKIDCEGGEEILSDLLHGSLYTPMCVEIHSKGLAELFERKFPNMKVRKMYHFPFNTWMGIIDG